jgi:hypothetical protein
MTGDLARQAADKAHAFAGWLDQRDPGSLLEEIRQLARRKPGTFLLGAALAGVAAGRLTRGAVDANSSATSPDGTGVPAGSSMHAATPIGDQASTAVFSTSNSEAGPLVVEPERTPARQSAAGTGFDMAEDRP